MIINAMGLACPIPVIQTKKAIKSIENKGQIEVLVDNEASMENLIKMANEMNLENYSEKLEEYKYKVTIIKGLAKGTSEAKNENLHEKSKNNNLDNDNLVVAISSDKMGEGIDELGEVLMKGFIYTLTEMEVLPKTILFYNGGAKLTIENAPTIEDLKILEESGVEILTCGTCLNYYRAENKLKVGKVTNMYDIVDRLQKASKIIKQ